MSNETREKYELGFPSRQELDTMLRRDKWRRHMMNSLCSDHNTTIEFIQEKNTKYLVTPFSASNINIEQNQSN